MGQYGINETISYKAMVDSIQQAAMIFIVGHEDDLKIRYSNRFIWQLFDCRTEEEFMKFCDGNFMNLISMSDRGVMETVVKECRRLNNQQEHRSTYRIVTRKGIEKKIEDSGTILQVVNGEGVVFTIYTEIDSQETEVERDRVTGALNKDSFYVYADHILRQAETEGDEGQYSFVYTNIRNFRYYNMKFGRHAGNLLLQKVVSITKEREDVLLVSRVSSDHFLVMSKSPNMHETVEMCNSLFDKDYDGTGLKLQSGVYHIKHRDMDVELACDYAKIASDTIRDTNRSVAQYDEALEKKLEIENFIDAHFNDAIENEHFQVYYQPVIRTLSGVLCGAEALTRWVDPQRGFLTPGDFIPALERKRLITKLDLYTVRKVCRDIRDTIAAGRALVPISLNLSKLDFIECDVFEEIESIIWEYDIPRDMIHIELTESVVMSDQGRLKKIIAQFREAGYEVWMDDFGSELSSLNMLDEYNFDEIKLDMLFMRTFDQRSRDIIMSVIQMAKRLGIHTLAEGVETREQYEYLREIGCEKVQGYYYSKPLTKEEFWRYPSEHEIAVESRAMHKYYDQIGKIDRITDRTLALVESDKKRFRFLYVNDEFERISREIGDGSFIFTEFILNSPASTLSRKFWALQSETKYGEGFKEMDYSVNGKYFRLRSKCISTYGDYSANQVEIENLTIGELDEKKEKLDYIFRMMYSMYDDIFILDEDSSFKNVMSNHSKREEQSERPYDERSYITRTEICRRYVYLEDQDEFMRFTDPLFLKERLRSEPRGYETRYFRNRVSNGAYVWKANTIQYISDTDMLIYSTRPAFFENKELLDKIASDCFVKYENNEEAFLWRSLQHSNTINLYWKDTERRFLGVNKKFLETFGHDSADFVIGKTDEEMRWHINDDPFREDEIRVLEKGERIINHIGKCIIKGVLHTVMTSKEPMYQDGQIIGLVGTFIDLNETNIQFSNPHILSVTDPITGLLSTQGIAYALTEYMEAWTTRKECFAVIHLSFSEYERALGTYGNVIVHRMSIEIGEILKQIAGNDSSIARLYAGTFVLLQKYTDREEIREVARTIQKRMREIKTLAGVSATVNPNIRMAFSEDDPQLGILIALATENMVSDQQRLLPVNMEHLNYKRADRRGKEKRYSEQKPVITYLEEEKNEGFCFSLYDLIEKYEEAKEWIYVVDLENHHLVYINRRLREVYRSIHKISNVSMEYFIGKRCYEVLHQSGVPCSVCMEHELQYGHFKERTINDEQFKGEIKLKNRLIDVNGRRCLLQIAHFIPSKALEYQELEKVGPEHALLNNLLSKAVYDHDPQKSIAILLEYFSRYLKADRAEIAELEGGEYFSTVYEWCRAGVAPEKEKRQHLSIDLMFFWRKHISCGQSVLIKDMEDVREKHPEVYYSMKKMQINSLVVYPLWKDGKIGGFYAFENPAPTLIDTVVPILRTVGYYMESLMVSRDLIRQLEYLSFSDQMTGLGNRFALERYKTAIKSGQSLGVIFCDVSGLKRTNDTLGHEAGDHLLYCASEALMEALGDYELFRTGGDEFCAIATDISEKDFNHHMEDLRSVSDKKKVPLAIGGEWIARITEEDIETMFDAADKQMYQDKEAYYSQTGIERRENVLKNI
ncbi:MAG: EAL domain-containing protein [Eubacteriales bacterium]|nr:EAL domain-containing protein [Eubacteriales bacterium]